MSVDLNALKEEVFQNKVKKGFNISNVELDIAHLHGEVSEVLDAYVKKKDDLGEELADVIIYVLGLSKMLNIDIELELKEKIEKNRKRKYIEVDGILTKIEDAYE